MHMQFFSSLMTNLKKDTNVGKYETQGFLINTLYVSKNGHLHHDDMGAPYRF
jgi:hypothetical protein